MCENNMFMDDPTEKKKHRLFSRIHLYTCIWCAMVTAYYLLLLVAVILDSLHDLDKYGGLGFSHTYLFYLEQNHFFTHLILFLCTAAEFILYLIFSLRTNDKKGNLRRRHYFLIMLIVHVVLWLYITCLQLPDPSSLQAFDETMYIYRSYAHTSVLPSILYFSLYHFRVNLLSDR